MKVIEELNERLEILHSADMIDQKVVDFCQMVISILFKIKEDYSTESLEIFVTHLAMASQRALKNEAEGDISQDIINAVKLDPAYTTAKLFLEKMMKKTDIVFPDSEKNLLLIHLCNIFGKK
ncbi:MAG: PRD domain-containing protein [Bacilli bacterium]